MNLKFNHKIFFDKCRAAYGDLTQSQVEGLEALLTGIENDPEIADVRWAAYMLATVKHECANKYQPLEEYGKGKDHGYGKPVKVTGSDGQIYINVYYGRGYVQLTWDPNYRNLSAALGYGDELLCHPNRVLQKDVAYKIMSYGMRNGIFTKHSLHEFISGGKCNYHGARKIVNGLDKADLIAGYAKEFEQMLIAAQEAEPAQVDEIPTGNPSETDLSQSNTSSPAQPGSQPLASENAANGSANFSPETIKQALPQIKNARHWLGGGAVASFIAMISTKLAGMPDWMVFFLGFLCGVLTTGLVIVIIQHRHNLGKIFQLVAQINGDPTSNNIETVTQ